MKKKSEAAQDDVMNSREDFDVLVAEHDKWKAYPLNGDAKRPPKETIITRVAMAQARKDASNAFAYRQCVAALRQGTMTPTDYGHKF